MSAEQEFYKNVRPSDMRFENAHVLAEYITQAQKLIDSSSALSTQVKSSSDSIIKPLSEIAAIASSIATKHDAIHAISSKLVIASNTARIEFDAHVLAEYAKLNSAKMEVELLKLDLEKERFIFNAHVSKQLKKIRAAKNPDSVWQRILNVFNPVIYSKQQQEQSVKLANSEPDLIPETRNRTIK